MDTCETCRFWRGTPAKPQKGDTPAMPAAPGPCHFNPPTVIGMTTQGGQGARPRMRPDEWCGRHETAAQAVAKANRDRELLEEDQVMVDGAADRVLTTLTAPPTAPAKPEQPNEKKGG